MCYTGTHDNSPLALWKDEAAPEDIAALPGSTWGLNDEEGFTGASSERHEFRGPAVCGPDAGLSGAGAAPRTNIPGTQIGNWQWRLLPDEATPALARRIRRVTELYGR